MDFILCISTASRTFFFFDCKFRMLSAISSRVAISQRSSAILPISRSGTSKRELLSRSSLQFPPNKDHVADESASRREWFYYLDKEGRLYHLGEDKTATPTGPVHLKDQRFLNFFFRRVQPNSTDRYREFPWLSICMGEYNYLRVNDTPIVFTELLTKGTI